MFKRAKPPGLFILPPPPPVEPWVKLIRALLIAVAVAVVAAVAVVVVPRFFRTVPCASCVTAGSEVFDPGSPAMQTVEQDIEQENAVARRGPYVTVALLTPLTSSPASNVSLSRIVDEIRGAYLAQYFADSEKKLSPAIQLILDNEGTSQELTWKPAVEQLETMEGVPDHLVAVIGLGVSVTNSVAGADMLSSNGMPMFGAVTTADQLDGSHIMGMDRVVPGISVQVQQLVARLRAPRRGVLVYDQQASDLYTADLSADFSRAFGKSLTEEPEPYTPGLGNVTATGFGEIADNVCYTAGPPPVVFYAGRESVLSSLISQFQLSNNCRDKKITVVTGGDADGLSPTVTTASAGDAQVSVIYSDIVNMNKLSPQFEALYQANLGATATDDSGLGDPWTIATYDAMTAAWNAINDASRGVTGAALVTKQDVESEIDGLYGGHAMLGATGLFSIGVEGEVISPDIPIFELAAGQRTTVWP